MVCMLLGTFSHSKRQFNTLSKIDIVSIEGRDLVEKMLHSDPEKRISSSDALKHPWITRRAPHPSWQDGAMSSVAESGDGACTVQ